jgi:hypothetical protein
MKLATWVKCVWKFLFVYWIYINIYWICVYVRMYMCIYIYIAVSLHTKFADVVCLEEGQFLPAMENRVKFLISWHGILILILSIKEGQHFDPTRAWM